MGVMRLPQNDRTHGQRTLPREIAADEEVRDGVRVFSIRYPHALIQLTG